MAGPALARRESAKRWLSRLPQGRKAAGATVLIYHRVGGGSPDERDVALGRFEQQVDVLASQRVVSIDDAVAAVAAGDASPTVVLTFDDGFRDLYSNAFPLLRERGLPFTLYLTSGYVGGTMRWDGSTARDADPPALRWDQLDDMMASGLCTLGNHTHTHVRPGQLSVDELDRCSEVIENRFGRAPEHFAYTWGVPVPGLDSAVRQRFRSAATGRLGRLPPGSDLLRLHRIPVRGSDPLEFFLAKLGGTLLAERMYAGLVNVAKKAGARG